MKDRNSFPAIFITMMIHGMSRVTINHVRVSLVGHTVLE